MTHLTFYSKPNCHLCEDGQWILEEVLKERPMSVTYIDISQDEVLMAQYGTRIPVLGCSELETDLGWPFTPDDILAWLNTA